ncbi:hypothetical protein NEPAR08_1840 [Nematocida parisii]|nr:hypothetical protein NEPAR08_1840 [Nematocida parisii]
MHIKSICKNIAIIWTSSEFTRNVFASTESGDKNMFKLENSDKYDDSGNKPSTFSQNSKSHNSSKVSDMAKFFESQAMQRSNSNESASNVLYTGTLCRRNRKGFSTKYCLNPNNTASLGKNQANGSIEENQENNMKKGMSGRSRETLTTNQLDPDYNKTKTNQPEATQKDLSTIEANQPEATQKDLLIIEANQPEANQPEASQPEATQKDLSTIEANQPEANQPEATQKDLSTIEATQPEANQPEATQPEATQKDLSTIEANQPEANQPEATQPEATQPEANQPEATQPEAIQKGLLAIEANQPEASQPEATQKDLSLIEANPPEANQPEATQPEAIQKGLLAIEANQPEASQPEATQKDLSTIEATQPEANQPEATQPEAIQKGLLAIEANQPEASQPEATQPEAIQKGLLAIEANQPEASQPEATQKDLSLIEANQPEATQKDLSLIEANQPEASQPEATQKDLSLIEANPPEATQPEANQPEATQKDLSTIEATQPEASQPEATQKDLSLIEANQPEASQPEATQKDLSTIEANQPEATQKDLSLIEANQPEAIPKKPSLEENVKAKKIQRDESLKKMKELMITRVLNIGGKECNANTAQEGDSICTFSGYKEQPAHNNKGAPTLPSLPKKDPSTNENNLGSTERIKCNEPDENDNNTETTFSSQLKNMVVTIQSNKKKSGHKANKAGTSESKDAFYNELSKKLMRNTQQKDDVSPTSNRRGSKSYEDSSKVFSGPSSLDNTNSIDINTNEFKAALDIRRKRIGESPITSEEEDNQGNDIAIDAIPGAASTLKDEILGHPSKSFSLDENSPKIPTAINPGSFSGQFTPPPPPPPVPTDKNTSKKNKNSNNEDSKTEDLKTEDSKTEDSKTEDSKTKDLKTENMPTRAYLGELKSLIDEDGKIVLKKKRKITGASIEKSLPNLNGIKLINFNAEKDGYKGEEPVYLTENINMDKDALKKLISDYNFRWLFVNAKDPSKNILITTKSICEMTLKNVIKEEKPKENEHASLSNRTAKNGYKVYIRKYQVNTDQNDNSYLLFTNEKKEIQYVINSECHVLQNSENQQFNSDLGILQKKNLIWDSVITIGMVSGEKEFISIKGLNEKSEKVLGVASLTSETTQMLLNRLFSKPENLSKEMQRDAMIYQMNLFLNEIKTSAFRKLFYAYQLFIGEKFNTSLDQIWDCLVKKYSYYSDKNTTDKHNYSLQYTTTSDIKQALSDAIENYIKYPVEGSMLTLKVGPILELLVSKVEESPNKRQDELIWFKSAMKEIKFVKSHEILHAPVIFIIETCADKSMKLSIYGENSECIYKSKENKGKDTKHQETNTIKSILSNNWTDKELLAADRIPINDESSIFIFQLLRELNDSKYAKKQISGL